MRTTHLLADVLGPLVLIQPPALRERPAPEPVARLLVATEERESVWFSASAAGGRLRSLASGSTMAPDVTARTPAIIEVYGSPPELQVQSEPGHPLRLRVVGGDARHAPESYHGWSFHLRRTDDRYVPVAHALRVP